MYNKCDEIANNNRVILNKFRVIPVKAICETVFFSQHFVNNLTKAREKSFFV